MHLGLAEKYLQCSALAEGQVHFVQFQYVFHTPAGTAGQQSGALSFGCFSLRSQSKASRLP
jgi:hypothetical protein